MPSRSNIVLLVLVIAVFAASYGLRFGLMEDGQWVGICSEQTQRWECQVRAALGLLVHFRAIAWVALILGLTGFFISHRSGWLLAAAALLCAIPALVLYSASLAVFALVLASLRLVRSPAATA